MSDIIRSCRHGAWTPPPQANSLDVRPPAIRDFYRFTQNQIESEQRQAQRAVNRTVRASAAASMPVAPEGRTIQVPASTNFVINLPIQ